MLDELKDLVEEYRRKLSLKLVVLFGSRARGDYTDKSDVDILVVADELPKDPREAFVILRDIRFININPIGFNTEVFIKKLKTGSTFILEILDEGKIMYVNKEFQEQLMNIYKEVRGRYVRRGKLWTIKNYN
ncbi:MAG: nucleotidyltransferase domain-containing protein [Sulfolobales archaeon]